VTRISKRFSAEDLRQVEAAVERAEAATSGELVTYIAGASDAYPLAAWKGAALGAVAGALVATGIFTTLSLWGDWIEAWLSMPALFGGAVGYLLGRFVEPIRRALIDVEILAEHVQRRATEAFLDEEVFQTRDRTGILLFVSVFERRVVVLADSGIRQRVPQAAWDGLVEDLVVAIRSGEAAAGLVAAVDACGGLFAKHRVARRADDANELADSPRLEERE